MSEWDSIDLEIQRGIIDVNIANLASKMARYNQERTRKPSELELEPTAEVNKLIADLEEVFQNLQIHKNSKFKFSGMNLILPNLDNHKTDGSVGYYTDLVTFQTALMLQIININGNFSDFEQIAESQDIDINAELGFLHEAKGIVEQLIKEFSAK